MEEIAELADDPRGEGASCPEAGEDPREEGASVEGDRLPGEVSVRAREARPGAAGSSGRRLGRFPFPS